MNEQVPSYTAVGFHLPPIWGDGYRKRCSSPQQNGERKRQEPRESKGGHRRGAYIMGGWGLETISFPDVPPLALWPMPLDA